MITLETIGPALRILADTTGSAPSEDTLDVYVQHFRDLKLMPEAVNQAVRRIAVDWDKSWWPRADYIAQITRKMQTDVMNEMHGIRSRRQEMEDVSNDAASRDWQDREHRANEWFKANPEKGARIIADIDRDIALVVKTEPGGRMATKPKYRDAYREGAIVGACLLRMTRELARSGNPKARSISEPLVETAKLAA
ncbi:MAG: hypothetical protein ACR2KM_08810 [Gemmatimonadaceae bacterium]